MVMTDTPTRPRQTTQPLATASASASAVAVEAVTCDTCGFTEDCTAPYIRHVRDRHKGKWLCGLCAEAVKDEVVRSPKRISLDEALRRHTTFCHRFRHSVSCDSGDDPISLMVRILRRSLDGSLKTTTVVRTSSTGALPAIDDVDSSAEPSRSLIRSESCF